MIEVAGVSKSYGAVPAVRDVSFTVNAGEIVGFLGPNGAGKTTTMRIITGYMPATTGRVSVAGFDVAEDAMAVKKRIGYLPENVPLYPEMLVRSYLNYVCEIKGVSRSNRRGEVDEIMDRVGLQGMGHRPIAHLSKGYRQRVGLAQALIGNPPVLILDEPTVGLDPRQIIEIRELIRSLAPEHTVLLSTHILPEVQMICERVVIIHQGRIVAEDTMAELRERSGAQRVELRVSGEVDAVKAALQSVDGAESVTHQHPDVYVVNGSDTTELSQRLAAAVAQGGFGLRSLQSGARSLEEVFVDAISTEKAEA